MNCDGQEVTEGQYYCVVSVKHRGIIAIGSHVDDVG